MHRWNFLALAGLYLSLSGCGKPVILAEKEGPIRFREPFPAIAEPGVEPVGVTSEFVTPPKEEPVEIIAPETIPVPAVIDEKTNEVAPPPVVTLPVLDSPLTPEGRKLIYDYEVGGGRPYYDLLLRRPTWPGASSGVTVAIGYDLGYNSRAVILQDWHEVAGVQRLANVSGITGRAARNRLPEVRDIGVRWELAEQVYDRVTVTRFWLLCRRTYPGFDTLRRNGQAALLSLTFNRGDSTIGERRREMKEIARLCPKQDYDGMARQLELMVRIWRGTDVEKGLTRRRHAEARLMRTP